MTYSSKHLFHIDATRQQVFEAIASVEGLKNWWTTKTSGGSEVGEMIKFDFGTINGPLMKITELVPGERLAWQCVESEHGWEGHTFIFNLDENDGKTRVRFSHNGFEKDDDGFAICNFSWGRYMQSLRQYCQTGTGEAFGSPGYR